MDGEYEDVHHKKPNHERKHAQRERKKNRKPRKERGRERYNEISTHTEIIQENHLKKGGGR